MQDALALAERAASAGEVPVGAVIMQGARRLGAACNETLARRDPTAHAEMLALAQALAAARSDRLSGATLYVTLEPCAQCAGALVLAKMGRVVYGAPDPKAGMAGSVSDLLRHPHLNHRAEVLGGILGDACGRLLREFFEARR